GDRLWLRLEPRIRRAARISAVVERASRFVLPRLSATVGWPPPAEVLWELVPLREPAPAFERRWLGTRALLTAMLERVRAEGAQPILLFVPLDLQVSRARNRLYRDGALANPTHG